MPTMIMFMLMKVITNDKEDDDDDNTSIYMAVQLAHSHV